MPVLPLAVEPFWFSELITACGSRKPPLACVITCRTRAVCAEIVDLPRRLLQSSDARTAAYRRATLALFCAGFATFALLYCVQPLLPLLAVHFSVSAAGSSLALSLTTLSLALCLLVAGALAERFGRKPLMVLALGLASLLGLACALVDNWNHLLWLRASLGLALSGLPALAMAYVGEAFDSEALPAAMGLYIGGTALGGLLGRRLAAHAGRAGTAVYRSGAERAQTVKDEKGSA